MTPLRRVLPPFLSAAVLLTHSSLMYRAALKHTHGVFSYPVDDTFIHLALAKHLALDGFYGVTSGEFASASSSVGWPYLLAASIKIAGPQPWLPLALNAVIGVLLAFVIDASVRRLGVVSLLARTLLGLAVVELTPLPTLVVLGMEHTAHTAANIALIAAGALWLSDSKERSEFNRNVFVVAALAFNASLWRYEGAFPTAIIAGLALLRRRPRAGAFVLAAGALPGVAFGLYAKAKGSLFLPVPVVLKGRHFDEHFADVLGIDLMDRLGAEASILVVAIACAVVFVLLVRTRGFWTPLPIALVVTVVVMMLHLNFASIGWFFRYESYLLATGITFAIAGFAVLLPAPRDVLGGFRRDPAVVIGALASVFLLLPLRKRAIVANNDTPIACRNIYEQQMQSGRFLARFKSPVAVNDLGAVVWLGSEPVIDLVGLANLPIAKAKGLKLMQPLKTADLARFTADAHVVIIYDEWFAGNPLPSQWLRVARWRIDDNRSCAFPGVSVYATRPEYYPEVIAELRKFAPELPPKVGQSGRYRQAPSHAAQIRSGDVITVSSTSPDFAGVYVVDDEGKIYLPRNKPGPISLVGASPDELSARMTPVFRGGPPDTHATHVAAHLPRVTVVGGVAWPADSVDMTLSGALAIAGAHDGAGLWLWREREDGSFVKLARSELGEKAVLEDGDIVIAR